MSEANRPREILRVENLKKRFGAVQALKGVNLHVSSGEVLALVGDNGAGKSTTIKMVSGVDQPDEGTISIEGRAVKLNGPSIAEALGIQTVYQDLALCDNLDIVSNLFLGKELKRPLIPGVLSVVDKEEMEKRAVPVLDSLGIHLPPLTTPVASLSGGQRQTVAVARAVLWGSKLVLLDEPTAALGVAQTRSVLNLIRTLAKKDIAVLVISHNLTDVFQVADRITVLRHGETVAHYKNSEVTNEDVVAAITGASRKVEM
ncbi:ABC transporter ATP-binding protein [Pullulanibacillus camelliae]|uniref:ABC transporter ATP-binding protein n=1 Tax=Pullulanibacillus camelliae TaxID=1707096 RepID=A0A8J2YDX8_9BACL|nr:ATP-binding cassette domain-containing protein [Pullulanibacillus camelliae]GGE27395.1 ABC transporter ATP-binding protein [Pullulanibacillus camelliae]